MRIFLLAVLAASTAFVGGCTSVGYKTGVAKCAPVYGNWCGENYPFAGYNPPPVDDWDRACRTHDRCYDSGASKSKCDRELVARLEELSYEQLAPMRMHNAHSWFRKDGSVVAWLQFTDEVWGMTADCRGGSGRKAQFFCAVGYQGCPLDPDSGPGHAGMSCRCGFYLGVIVER